MASLNTCFFRSTKSSRFNLIHSSHQPMNIITNLSQSNYLASINDDVQAHIEQALLSSQHQPASVFKPMHHLAFAAPTTKSSALCVAACEMVGGHRDQAIPAASALHLMHSAAFIHENLLLSDKRLSKQPNDHHIFDTNIELITADALSPLGYQILALSTTDADDLSEQILRVIIEISTAMGSQGMVNGQYIEQLSSKCDEMGWIHNVCEKKQGRLYACGAACGAILGGGSNEEIEKLRRFGFYVGMMNGIEELEEFKMIQGFRNFALKELDSFQDKNIDNIQSFIMDGFVPNPINEQAKQV